jgi:hypothetical protein
MQFNDQQFLECKKIKKERQKLYNVIYIYKLIIKKVMNLYYINILYTL